MVCDALEKTHAGKDSGHEEKGATEDETVGWHHRLNGHGDGEGQESVACYSPWVTKSWR